MIRFFNIMMLVLEGLLGAGCIALGFLEHGALPKLLYILGGILLLPVLPLPAESMLMTFVILAWFVPLQKCIRWVPDSFLLQTMREVSAIMA